MRRAPPMDPPGGSGSHSPTGGGTRMHMRWERAPGGLRGHPHGLVGSTWTVPTDLGAYFVHPMRTERAGGWGRLGSRDNLDTRGTRTIRGVRGAPWALARINMSEATPIVKPRGGGRLWRGYGAGQEGRGAHVRKGTSGVGASDRRHLRGWYLASPHGLDSLQT